MPRLFGRLFKKNGDSVCIKQSQTAQPDGNYKIADQDKVKEFYKEEKGE